MSAPVSARLIIPFNRFPASHQTLWKKGMTERDRYGSLRYGVTLSPYTERGARSGWGRFLATCSEEERSTEPVDLVAPETVRRFVNQMEQSGNRSNTVANRICQVRVALRIMRPEADFSWLTSPDGNNVRSLFQSDRRPIKIYHSLMMYRWGLQLMDQALRIDRPKRRAVQYRNGLMIAILAARAPRLRSIAAPRLGIQIIRHDDRFRFVFGKQDLKWSRASQEYKLPSGLTCRIEHYLTIERPILLAGSDHDWLWVGLGGARLRERGIESTIRRQSWKRFGETFGPHRFRHGAGTIAPMADPKHPAAVAAMLGHSKAVSEKAYNMGRQLEVCRKYQANFRLERRRLEGIALRAFGRDRTRKKK